MDDSFHLVNMGQMQLTYLNIRMKSVKMEPQHLSMSSIIITTGFESPRPQYHDARLDMSAACPHPQKDHAQFATVCISTRVPKKRKETAIYWNSKAQREREKESEREAEENHDHGQQTWPTKKKKRRSKNSSEECRKPTQKPQSGPKSQKKKGKEKNRSRGGEVRDSYLKKSIGEEQRVRVSSMCSRQMANNLNEEEVVTVGATTALLGAMAVLLRNHNNRDTNNETRILQILRQPYVNRDVDRENYINSVLYCGDTHCLNQIRMRPGPFFKLCEMLDTKHMSVREQVLMFLHLIGHNVRFRAIGESSFVAPADIISKKFNVKYLSDHVDNHLRTVKSARHHS
ncbi:hypothetical protein Cgig2_018990 [Carnegiea gigantea]|uniref:DUF8040 domain-containing protein n=1 Tax=Carnegiea gigantea TaxID=171969 RepID=A0A9Q1JQC3_9CARY|nr:hypothetical protein Cgig2_018990 [Carnegiea gigantea]